MAITRDFANPFAVTDMTAEFGLIPNTWGLINELGIFEDRGITQHTATLEYSQGSLGLITDQVRGAKNLANKDDVRKLITYPVAHFPLDDYISPNDLVGIRAYGTMDAAENEAAVIARKLQRIRQSHAATIEAARAYAITNLAPYAPNGTVAGDYAADYGVTRTSVDFVLGTSTTDIIGKIESVISTVQDNVQNGGVINDIVVLASPEFFTKLIAHAKVAAAFQYYSSTQEPLRNRLGSGLYRRFEMGGLTVIEYRGSYNGQRLIPAGKAYAVPRGVQDMFLSIWSPANKFSLVGTVGESSGYVFTYRSPEDEKIVVQSEHNALHVVTRPAATVELTTSN
jgi:hypothetical protein